MATETAADQPHRCGEKSIGDHGLLTRPARHLLLARPGAARRRVYSLTLSGRSAGESVPHAILPYLPSGDVRSRIGTSPIRSLSKSMANHALSSLDRRRRILCSDGDAAISEKRAKRGAALPGGPK